MDKPIPSFYYETKPAASPYSDMWYFLPIASVALTGTVRYLTFFALKDTLIERIQIGSNSAVPRDTLIYVVVAEGARGVTLGTGYAFNYHDYILTDRFVLPNGHYLVIRGSGIATEMVGFSIIYKGALQLKSDTLG